ncbi:Lysophospholipase L1 [Amycolatopsis arida]|uniref:Lysophospholipase L1 n=1 Tax=Amycolatopsis arida TaxID=587909 RepID=A0A1I5SH18_9PSEU|nr:SGNH/GDSL hydrolase family protein [Amycolatopsis arida]TDX96476.1 lysophospholipase L1-like esterase [Amycolatopsis arida]SFP70015.1 Lysophospholipase L1 [Amycolatopsis arida]
MVRQLVATLATVALAPALVAQGLRLRRSVPRLPDAAGPHLGVVGSEGPPLRLLVIGESTVAGVGARDHGEALTGQLAAELSRRTGRPVRWRAIGRSGATAGALHGELAAGTLDEPADVVVVALGVNDTVALHAAPRYRRDLLRLIATLRARLGPVPVVLTGVPPLAKFPALPQPLRTVLGLRARALDAAAASLVALPGVAHAPLPRVLLTPGSFATDGFHPGPAGYRLWADHLARVLPPPAR